MTRQNSGLGPYTVTGTVTSVRALGAREPGKPISEHDPAWAFATIQVDSSTDPAGTANSIHVVFATSMDVAWAAAPKLRVGQRGTFTIQPFSGRQQHPMVTGFVPERRIPAADQLSA